MIVITVELWPGGRESEKRTLASMVIVNDGTGSETRGNYDYLVAGKRGLVGMGRGRIENWHRQSQHVWKLVRRVLAEVYP